MLQSIRDRTQGWVAGVIISLLIVSFAFWGVHSYFTGQSTSSFVAKVNGTPISKAFFSENYARMKQQSEARLQTATLSASLQDTLRKRTLEELITLEILQQASLSQGYRISHQRIDAILSTIPAFQLNGKFSMDRFQKALESGGYTPQGFIDLLNATALIDQPRQGLLFTSFALPGEIENSIALVNQKRDIDYALVPFQSSAAHPIQEADIKQYYDAHLNDFQTPEKVSIEYIALSLDKKEKQGSKAEQLFAEHSEKLANLAYEHPESLAIAANALGLTIQTSPLFTRDQGDGLLSHANVREIAFSHDVFDLQNNSDVIPLDSRSVVVVRVKEKVPAGAAPFATVKQIIRARLEQEKGEEGALSSAQLIEQQLKTGKTSAALTWHQAGFVGRHTAKINSSILDTAFALPIPVNDTLSFGVAKVPTGVALIRVKAVQPGQMLGKEEYRVFAEQIQSAQGLAEYQLYQDSAARRAKVVLG